MVIDGLKKAPNKWVSVSIILWVTFLMAGIATGVFFSIVDPITLGSCITLPEVSRTAAYSIGFFLFWVLTFSSAYISHLFLVPSKDS